MFQTQFRLPSRARLVGAQSFTTSDFILRISPNNLMIHRFGFVAGKSVDKRAVVRNRTKRVVRSIIEDVYPQLHPGYDMLFLLKKPILKRTTELEESVKEVLQKAGVISNKNDK